MLGWGETGSPPPPFADPAPVMMPVEPPLTAAPPPSTSLLPAWIRKLKAPPSAETLAFLALLPLVAWLLAIVHGLLPGQLDYLPVAFAYSGIIECLAKESLLAAPVCESLGFPVGYVPLTDAPYLKLAALVHRLGGVEVLTAKSLTDGAFLALSFFSLVALQQRLGINRLIAALVATCYLVLPLLLGHAGIHAYSVGLLLLPAYLLADHLFLSAFGPECPRLDARRLALSAVAYTVLRTLSVFQDGYTAVMAIAVSAVLFFAAVVSCLSRRRFGAAAALIATWLSSVLVAAGLYNAWVPGGTDYEVMSIDFFRAQGVDVISLFVPSAQLWWAKVLGVGVAKWNAYAYYGDGTNVGHNYLGYTLLVSVALAGVWLLARRSRPARLGRRRDGLALAVAGGLCFVLSLGPSLKIDNRRAADPRERFEYADYFMTPESATFALPTEKLFVTLPGLQHTRAVYRWIVIPKLILLLGFGWVATRVHAVHRGLGLLLAALVLAEQFPDLPDLERSAVERYAQYREFDRNVVTDMEGLLIPGERVFFLSDENDYLVNHITPRLGVRSYNVGGDKSAAISERHWPELLRQLRQGLSTFDPLAPLIARALLSGEVDAIVIPYFDLRWHAYTWPPTAAERQRFRRLVAGELDPAPAPLRLTEAWWFAVVTVDDRRPQTSARYTLRADPNPIVVCDGSGMGITTLSWKVTGPSYVDIRVGSPSGKLFAQLGPVASVTTGPWVADGMEFFLQDVVEDGRPATRRTLARLVVEVSDVGCPGG